MGGKEKEKQVTVSVRYIWKYRSSLAKMFR